MYSTRHSKASTTTRGASSRHEGSVAKSLGGRCTINSGATDHEKGDVVLDNFLVECKTLMKPQKQFTVKSEWFDTLKENARVMNKGFYALSFNFGDNTHNYYVIPETMFKNIVALINQIGEAE